MPDFVSLFDLYEEYQQEDGGPMKAFWNSYLYMVSLMMSLIRATREGNWHLHLECIKQMLPWFFAYDHVNYSRYLSTYLIHMTMLPNTHPEAQMMLENGDFGVQRTTTHGFSQVPVDQTIEQTLNRSTKTKGGIVGFSLRKSAVQRWLLTAHSRARFVDKCRNMTADTRQAASRLHKETGTARLRQDEEDVRKVLEVVSNWNNPFDESDELISISTGCVASNSMKDDLLGAKQKGKDAYTTFVQERLLSNSTGFHDTLSKLKLGTFSDSQKKTLLAKEGKTVILKADRNLFARLLDIGQSRMMDLRELLVHELGPMPWSLASFDGSLVKTNKAALSKLIEDGVESLQRLPEETSAVIIDAMALLQTLSKIPERFSGLAEMVFNRILLHAGGARRIDFVGDRYPNISIKNIEREKRGRGGHLIVNISSPQQLCPKQWKKFMSIGSNKEGFMSFLVNEWSTNQAYAQKIGNRTLYITHGNQCTKIVATEDRIAATDVADLSTNQEEADTRMFLHASHASTNGHQGVAIISSDTDVEVLACHHQAAITADITLVSGTRTRLRLISVPRLCERLGNNMCQVLPSLHALTGCDSISAFAGKGKKKALELAREDDVARSNMQVLGESVPLSEANMAKLEEVVCSLYNDRQCNDVNELRYKMFCKGRNVQSQQLPPTSAALKQHLKRANYQAHVWRRALYPETAVSPESQGWELRDGHLEITWTDLLPAPEAVMELVCCACKGSCQTRRCSCVKNGLPCTEACTCSDQCVNRAKEESYVDEEEEDEEDEEEL